MWEWLGASLLSLLAVLNFLFAVALIHVASFALHLDSLLSYLLTTSLWNLFFWAESLSEITSLPQKGRGKVCVLHPPQILLVGWVCCCWCMLGSWNSMFSFSRKVGTLIYHYRSAMLKFVICFLFSSSVSWVPCFSYFCIVTFTFLLSILFFSYIFFTLYISFKFVLKNDFLEPRLYRKQPLYLTKIGVRFVYIKPFQTPLVGPYWVCCFYHGHLGSNQVSLSERGKL